MGPIYWYVQQRPNYTADGTLETGPTKWMALSMGFATTWEEAGTYFMNYFLGKGSDYTPVAESVYQTTTYGYGLPSAAQIQPGKGVRVFGGDGQGSPLGIFDDRHGFKASGTDECDERIMLVSYVSATPDDSDPDTHWNMTIRVGQGKWFPFSGAVSFGKAAVAAGIVALSLY